MDQTYGRTKLLKIYRHYARRIGWTDHPMAALERVELWLLDGTGAVGDAIKSHNHHVRLRNAARKKFGAYFAMLMTSVAGAWIWFTA